jgi:release factor glutamine methyltransferase
MTLSAIDKKYQTSLALLYAVGEIQQLFLIALENVSGLSRSQYLSRRGQVVDDIVVTKMENILAGLERGEPIQHILGEAHFYGLNLVVSPDTLIPRPETEELVHLILQNHRGQQGLKIIDIGTGSGCIAVALAKGLSNSEVWAMDVSSSALSVARENARLYRQQINFVQGDILEWDMVFGAEQQFDVIVSNPPYITPKEKEMMHPNVLQYEPHLALFVEEEAPLLFYDYIADFALSHLLDTGSLYFEINQYLGLETADMLRKKGFVDVRLLKDINAVDRMIVAKKK